MKPVETVQQFIEQLKQLPPGTTPTGKDVLLDRKSAAQLSLAVRIGYLELGPPDIDGDTYRITEKGKAKLAAAVKRAKVNGIKVHEALWEDFNDDFWDLFVKKFESSPMG